MIEIGRVCNKTAGREKSQMCLIIDKIDDNFVLVSGPRVKRRRCNVKHLNPLPQKLVIKKGATDAEVIDALVKAGLVDTLVPKVKKKEKVESVKEQKEKKPEKPKKLTLFKKKEKSKKKVEKVKTTKKAKPKTKKKLLNFKKLKAKTEKSKKKQIKKAKK